MTPTFVDTSAHYAIADAGDYDHDAAVEFLHSATDEGRAFLTSNFIIAETYGLILLRLGRGKAIDYVQLLRSGSTVVERITPEDEERAWEILTHYDDQDFSYADATSFALMERLGILEAFAFDKHFDIEEADETMPTPGAVTIVLVPVFSVIFWTSKREKSTKA